MSENTKSNSQIHWFPGHMTKTLRRAQQRMGSVDAIVQLLDSRIPNASLNPELQEIYGSKPRLYVLNKSDLADPAVTTQWLRAFKQENSGCVAINSKQKGAASAVRVAIDEALSELFARRQAKGMTGAKTRLMVTGIPNVGKSTFINTWAGGAKAKAADRPGVTRGEQWVNAGAYELLDMPGVLWKRFDNQQTAVNLALIGSIPDRILNVEEIAAGLLQQMMLPYQAVLQARYKLNDDAFTAGGWQLLDEIGRKRGMLISGGEVNIERAAIMILDEFRGGKFGRISLEKPSNLNIT